MAGRTRYKGGAPVEWQYAHNGANPEDKRLSTAQAATILGVQKPTLFRWWKQCKFPDPAPGAVDPYQPDMMWKGEQMTLHWPVSVVEAIKALLAATAAVEGQAGSPRLPPKADSIPIKGGADAQKRKLIDLKLAIEKKIELLG